MITEFETYSLFLKPLFCTKYLFFRPKTLSDNKSKETVVYNNPFNTYAH